MANKYSCTLTKQEIIEIVVNHFHEVDREYEYTLKAEGEIPETLGPWAQGGYDTMIALLNKLHIQEEEV